MAEPRHRRVDPDLLRRMAELDGIQADDADWGAITRRLEAILEELARLEASSDLDIKTLEPPTVFRAGPWEHNE